MKNKFATVIAGLAVVLGMGSMVFPNFSKLVANAEETQTYFSVEDYTNDDKLLRADGNFSTKDILDFSTEVKNAPVGADCSEITQVIPRQYMESTETNAVYQYNGKEYGFYMVKEGDYFDLLLIDFVYEFTDGSDYNNQYKIRIEPLLQQSFLRESTDNGYTWRKCILDTRYTYYVANPRFASGLLNENALVETLWDIFENNNLLLHLIDKNGHLGGRANVGINFY